MSKLHIHEITKTNDGYPISMEVRNEIGDLSIHAKWDGCCDVRRYFNGITADDEVTTENSDNIDYIHICRMKEFIDELQQLVALAEGNLDKKDFEMNW